MLFRILSEATMAQIKLKKADTCYYDKSSRSFFVRSYVSGRCTFNVGLQDQNVHRSHCLGDAAHHGYRSMETNPCKNFKRYPSQNRPQFLHETQLTKLGVY